MLPEISLNVLDIVQNSVTAGASLIQITVEEITEKNRLSVEITDNGCGMTEEMLCAVQDPFFTTRTTRTIGLGIPFFKQEAEAVGGSFYLASALGEGTTIAAVFCTDHIDCMPLGDINATIHALITMHPALDFVYTRTLDRSTFVLDTREMREILGGIPFDEPDVAVFIKQYLEENETDLKEITQ